MVVQKLLLLVLNIIIIPELSAAGAPAAAAPEAGAPAGGPAARPSAGSAAPPALPTPPSTVLFRKPVPPAEPYVKPGCQQLCGTVPIPYPFGIGKNCSIDEEFEIICSKINTGPQKPFLNLTNSITNLRNLVEVLEISLQGTLRIASPITFFGTCSDISGNPKPLHRTVADLRQSSFVFSPEKNRFTSMSCGRIVLMESPSLKTTYGGCLSICDDVNGGAILPNNTCSGMNCCQTTITSTDLRFFTTKFEPVNSTSGSQPCKYAFLVDQDWFTSPSTNISNIAEMEYVPVVLSWVLKYSPTEIFGTNSWPDTDNSINSTICNDIRITSSSPSVCNRACMKSDMLYDPDQNSTQCICSKGFRGNPYLLHGCKDINECEDKLRPNICGSGICKNYRGTYTCSIHLRLVGPASARINVAIIVTSSVLGVLFLLVGGWWLHRVIKKRENIKRKAKFYKQNGGPLLDQQLNSGDANVKKVKLFDSNELDKATDHFNVSRILGQGGQGTVYKGMLTDGNIVAVKKSKIVGEEREVGQFINEIVILSQINHRNVVKLLGCCLETEVPLLVYEFIINGTLSHYIHHQDQNEEIPFTWEMRLRVAIEVAGALSYLHSEASSPIYHRDIKTSNILLDDKYRAKVADFGTSRSVAIDQTHVTTKVQGTFGYLDPQYFQSNQFTDKSDVYSFGVVLAELLTGQKPLSNVTGSLVSYFLLSMEKNSLFDILDARVMKDGKKEEIVAVANLAKRCLNLNGKERPTMKEVAVELEGIQLPVKASQVQQDFAEVEIRTEQFEAWDVGSTSTGSCMDTGTAS